MTDTPSPSLFELAERAMLANPGWLDEAVEEDEASTILKIPGPTLTTLRSRGGGPPFVKMGKSVRYIRRDLFAYLAERRRRSTSDTGAN